MSVSFVMENQYTMIFRLLVLLFLLIYETVVTFVFIAVVMRCESLADLNYLGFLLPFSVLYRSNPNFFGFVFLGVFFKSGKHIGYLRSFQCS